MTEKFVRNSPDVLSAPRWIGSLAETSSIQQKEN